MIRVNGYLIDAALTEEYTFNNEVTTHSVERGSPTTDHVLVLPDELMFDCVVSDTPMGTAQREREQQADVALSLIGSADADSIQLLPSGHAFQFLKALRDSAEPCLVECSRGSFSNRMVKTLVITQTAAGGKALRFKVGFTEITIAEPERAIVQVAIPRAANKAAVANKSSKTPPETPAATGDGERSSILWGLTH